MDKLKDPAMALSLANTAGLVGVTAYFYKQMEAMRADMIKVSQTLGGVVKKVTEMEKGDQNQREALHTLNNQIKDMTASLKEMPSINDFEDLNYDMQEVMDVLAESGMSLDFPSETRTPKVRRQKSSSRSSSRNRHRVPSPVSARPVRARRGHEDSSERSSSRNRRTQTRRPVVAPERSRSSSDEDDDDEDLINQVRKHQT